MKKIGVTKAALILNLLFMTILGMISVPLHSVAASSGGGDDLFGKGNAAYARGDYDEALTFYRQLVRTEGYTESLLYNIGNVFYQKGDFGEAILYYERALVLDPGNEETRHNLALARKQLGLPSKGISPWEKGLDMMSVNQWALLGAAAFALFALTVFMKGIRPQRFRRAWVNAVSGLCLIMFMLSGTGTFMQCRKLNQGVVTSGDQPLMVSPFNSAPHTRTLGKGSVVEMAKTYNEYVRVKDESGPAGWIPRQAVKAIIPDHPVG